MEEENFEELVEKSQKHDELAFTKLIHSIENEMYRIAKIKLKKDDDVFEALQNTIILIYKNIKKLKDPKKFKTWAIRILINECLKIIKSNKKNINSCIDYDENIGKIENHFEKVEAEVDLNKLLKYLNEDEKIVILLYYGQQYKIREIVEILSESEGTIKSRISRAKTKIKNHMKEESKYGE